MIGLQALPAMFGNYEGDKSLLRDRSQNAAHWIDVARALRAPNLQIPAHFKPDATGDKSIIVSELQQLADIVSTKEPLISVAYEPIS